MTHLLSPLANGRIILALEGGYNLTSIAYSMTLCTKALLGDPIPPLTLKETIAESALETFRNVLDEQSKYWTVLRPFRKSLPFTSPVPAGNYELKEDEEDLEEDILNMMEKLDVGSSSLEDPDDSANGNPSPPAPVPVIPVIPDAPPASGEPSLSVPRLPTAPVRLVQNNNNNNNNEQRPNSRSEGGGENMSPERAPAPREANVAEDGPGTARPE
jgi:hypothetical protein